MPSIFLSIITPTYNSEKTIHDCLLSVVKQKFLYYEHIIVDNISTDKTLDIVKKFNSITEVNKQFRTLVNWLGYKQINIPIKINERTSGKSKYNFISLFQLAVNNFTSFSLFPIKLIGWIGLFMTFFSIILVLIMLLDNIFLSNQLKINIQSIFLIIQILLTGVMLSSIAFLGLYISKILNNTNNRPSYIIEKKI